MAAALALSLLWTAASMYEFLIKSHSNVAILFGKPGLYFRAALTLQYSAGGVVVVFVTAFMIERVWPVLNRSAGGPAGLPDGATRPLQLDPGP